MFGQYNRVERFARSVARRAPKGPVEIGIGHAICKDDALELEKHLRKLLPDIRKLVVTGLGTGIGVHGGPRTLLVSMRPFFSAQDVARSAD
jgi:fatty acid-binding protein DegV